MKILFQLILLIGLLFLVNGVFQIVRKPSELLSLFSREAFHSMRSTWNEYRDEFEENETDLISAEYLAALSQVESAGNATATPEWHWRWTIDMTRIYAPASSSVGLFQYTDATFKDAKRFCIHRGRAVLQGKWYDPTSCWFTMLYSRLSASDSIEMTAARLDHYVRKLLRQTGSPATTALQTDNLASIIHLCGTRKGLRFAGDGFQLKSFQYCGSHKVASYLSRIDHLKKRLVRMQ